MRSLDEILETSPKGNAFSNGESWDRWSYKWCNECVNDINDDCPLVTAAMLCEVIPTEWKPAGISDYACTEFELREDLA